MGEVPKMIKISSPLNKIKVLAVLSLVVISLGINSGSVYADIYLTPDPLWNPILIGNNTIMPQTSEYLKYTLQAGKTYHIFLVGNWTEPVPSTTDYDVYVTGPNSEVYRFTEAKGLPEQVFNDGKGQFFITKSSGTYTFEIHNDEGNTNGNNAASAVFMVIEHVGTDRVNNATLLGRTSKSGYYPSPSQSTYACEFTTSSSNFTVHVNTPSDLDLYEVRLYTMSSLGGFHDLNGLPTPTGPDLVNQNATGGHGGYNFAVDGTRPLSFVSAYDYGEKVDIKAGTSGTLTTYFLVLIAEYSKTSTPSVVPFYIKTSGLKPKVTLNGTIRNVYANETTNVSAKVVSGLVVKSVWMNFTVNGVKGVGVTSLSKVGSLYSGQMPAFAAKDTVAWSICAEDEIGNVGRLDSSFKVKARTETSLYVSKGNVVGGDSVEVTGQTTLAGANLKLNFTSRSFKEIVPVKADQLGGYKYTYLPKQAGTWSVSAKFDGDDTAYPSESSPASFTMTPQPTTVSCTLYSPEIKVNQVLQLSGLTTPAVSGLPVEVTLASGSVSKTETLITKGDGSFSLSTPLEEGEWDVVAQVRGNWRYSSSSSGIVKATVHPLGIVDQAMVAAAVAATPPYLYVVVLAAVVGVVLVVRWRVGDLSSRMPKPFQDLLAKLSRKPKAREAGATGRYRRREEDS